MRIKIRISAFRPEGKIIKNIIFPISPTFIFAILPFIHRLLGWPDSDDTISKKHALLLCCQAGDRLCCTAIVKVLDKVEVVRSKRRSYHSAFIKILNPFAITYNIRGFATISMQLSLATDGKEEPVASLSIWDPVAFV